MRLATAKDKTHRLAVELFSGFCEEQGTQKLQLTYHDWPVLSQQVLL